jgi:hypothetical protein
MKKLLCLCLLCAGCASYKQTVVLSIQANDPASIPTHPHQQPHTTICVFPATAKAEVRWEK